MKRICIISLLATLFLSVSCFKEPFDDGGRIPEGQPVTMYIGFGTEEVFDVQVGTKAEASREDEHNVHDLYVLIFDKYDNLFYNRYFTYEHLTATASALNNSKNEGWFVDNVTVSDVLNDRNKTLENKKKTRGFVKISTESKDDCTLVLLANLTNTVFSLDGKPALERLEEIETLDELKNVKAVLQQNVVTRANLFLMLGKKTVNTGDLQWGQMSGSTPIYSAASQVELEKLDAKVKFRIKFNGENISSITPRNWEAHRVPENCYLFPDESVTRDTHDYFDAQPAFFDSPEYDETTGETYQVFSFYMLENRQTPKQWIKDYDGPIFGTTKSKYFLREKQIKDPDTGNPPYERNRDPLEDGWEYARKDATYVVFDMLLTLTPVGIAHMQEGIAEALTTEAFFTVHLGDFSNGALGFDDYNTLRGHYYTYDITINNSESIYIEVRGKNGNGNKQETEPGQEGSLLLTTQGVINCDAHYEYHSLTFNYNSELGKGGDTPETKYDNRKKYSWYIKTPFFEGGSSPTTTFNSTTGFYEVPPKADYQWVKFALNKMENGIYLDTRLEYPGYDPDDEQTKNNYRPGWNPGDPGAAPALMDVNQLINFVFVQNELEYRRRNGESVTSLFDSDGKLMITAFIDEYYYERHPVSGVVDPNLWREFVNAKPRELHILSDTEHSNDYRSDVIVSSHSIVQQSIQTIYNVYAPDLSSLWGAEHVDEMSYVNRKKHDPTAQKGWPWWSNSDLPSGSRLYGDEENGRLNTAGIWGLSEGTEQSWSSFLDYEVANNTPELKSNRFYQAYSCLTRNRDNNGNGVIDQEELRWYIASINQLVGMWIGNEALSVSARIYQPVDPNNTTDPELWRSSAISSTCIDAKVQNQYRGIKDPRILRAEEGATKSWYSTTFTGYDTNLRDKVMTVRCLRNIGTYSDQGTLKYISEVPFDKMADQYYDFEKGQDPNGKAWPNEDGTYTIRFSRLNAKSIREYTQEDLPYHDENSMNNRVYLRFTAQNPDDQVVADGTINKRQRVLNEEISRHNDYCPPGYRVPNLTELVMMSALLPSSYWNNKEAFPCRTYFSRGYLGTTLQTDTEKGKIGWKYDAPDNRVNLQNENVPAKSIRCIRDDNMIGDITGDIVVADSDHRRLSEDWSVDLNFFSLSSVIRSVQLKICYTDASGNKRELEIPSNDITLGGTTVHQTITISHHDLEGKIPVFGFMTLRAEVRNAAGITRYFDAPVRLVSQLYTSLKLLPSEYKTVETKATFPVLITASHMDQKVQQWTLRVTSPDKRTTTVDLTPQLSAGDPTYASLIYSYDPGTLKTGTYTFQLEAKCNDLITRSEAVSMDVLKADYRPVPLSVLDASYASVDELKTAIDAYSWKREMVQGLDFANGDFIEADMDVSRCVFQPKFTDTGLTGEQIKTNIEENGWTYFRHTGGDNYELLDLAYLNEHMEETYYILNTGQSVGLDNLISFGVSDIDWVNWSLHAFYPAVPSGMTTGELLRFNPVWDGGYAGINDAVIPKAQPIHIRLDKEGIYWNNTLMDVSQFAESNQANVQAVLDRLTNAKTLYVGSVGGGTPAHTSRAYYRFVRVVYNGEFSTTSGDSSSFDKDPVFGGNL